MKKFLVYLFVVIMEIIQLPIGILMITGSFIYSLYYCVQDRLSFREYINEMKESYKSSFKIAFALKKQAIVNLTEK